MALELFKSRLARELPLINAALASALNGLPAECQPVATHVISAGGKRLRPLLAVLFANLHGNRDPAIYRLAASMEMLHAATLLHDDILDQADSRRGRPAAHLVFGEVKTILAGDALLAGGNAIIASYRNPDLALAYSEATMRTAAGEICEMELLGNPNLAQEEYDKMAIGKTACLIAQTCALGAIFASAGQDQIEAASEYGENLGLAFQIVDDALDFSPASVTGKPAGGDLREGKLTPPLRLYRESLAQAEKDAFDKNFRERSFTDAQINEICGQMAPFAQKSLALADERLARARHALAKMPEAEEKAILFEMAEYVRSREK